MKKNVNSSRLTHTSALPGSHILQRHRHHHTNLLKTVMAALLCLTGTVQAVAQRYTPPPPRHQVRPATTYSHNYGYGAPTYFGMRLGVVGSNVTSDDQYLNGSSTKAGLNVGVALGVQLTPAAPLFFESGLYYTEKGGKGKYGGDKFTYNLNYLEVPLLLKYAIDVDRYASVQPFMGGYLACGVGGKIKDFGERAAYSSFENDNFRRFDGGIRVGCGAQFDMLYVELGYDFGLANVCNDYFDTSRNGALFANIGVNF